MEKAENVEDAGKVENAGIMENEKISVIMGIYNCAEYLPAAVEWMTGPVFLISAFSSF